jgi:ParB family chromosome partitioning protein
LYEVFQVPPRYESIALALGEIAIPSSRSRALQPDKVEAIAESFAKRGQLQNIIVTHGRRLVAGEHRLEAARSLKWDTIGCTVVPEGTSPDEVELIELDENFARAELSEIEKTAITLRRKELYDKVHPEAAKVGGDRSQARGEPVPTFAKDAAKKTGEGESTIKRRAARGRKLDRKFGKQAFKDIKDTSLDNAGELDALAELDKETALPLIARAKAGESVSAKKVIADRKKAADEEAARKAREAAANGIKPTMQAPPEKNEDHAAQETRELWVHRLNTFAVETVGIFGDDGGQPFDVAPLPMMNMEYLTMVFGMFIRMKAQKKEAAN